MMSVSFERNALIVDGRAHSLRHAIRDAFALDDRVIVLLDADSYLSAPSYEKEQRRGVGALRNLIALSGDGTLLWEAEFPEQVDYFYRVVSKRPLIALSFSSFRCEIDEKTGKIVAKEFFKQHRRPR